MNNYPRLRLGAHVLYQSIYIVSINITTKLGKREAAAASADFCGNLCFPTFATQVQSARASLRRRRTPTRNSQSLTPQLHTTETGDGPIIRGVSIVSRRRRPRVRRPEEHACPTPHILSSRPPPAHLQTAVAPSSHLEHTTKEPPNPIQKKTSAALPPTQSKTHE